MRCCDDLFYLNYDLFLKDIDGQALLLLTLPTVQEFCVTDINDDLFL